MIFWTIFVAAVAITGLVLGAIAIAWWNDSVEDKVWVDTDLDTFKPKNTLFVATGWPTDYDTKTYFTSIGGAMTQAAALSPSPTNQVSVIIYPGVYTEDVTVVSNVDISCRMSGALVSGTTTWTPGISPNAAQIGDDEKLSISNCFIDALTVNSTGKTGSSASGAALLYIDDTDITGAFSTYYRGESQDASDLDDITVTGNVIQSAGTVTLRDPIIGGTVLVEAVASYTQLGGEVTGLFTTKDSGTAVVVVGSYLNGVHVGNNTDFTARDSYLAGSLTTEAAATLSDIRSSEYSSFVGTGSVDRTLFIGTTTPSVVGSNQATLSPPYPNAAYKVTMTQTSGVAQSVLVTAKAQGSFNYTVTNVTAAFDFIITRV